MKQLLIKKFPEPVSDGVLQDNVLETEQYVTKGGHRPSQLYVFNPYWLETSLQEGVVDLWS